MDRVDATLVVDFLNTLDLEAGTDQLASATGLARWSEVRGYEAGARSLALAVRDALRDAVEHGAAGRALPSIVLTPRFGANGVTTVGLDVASAVLGAAIRLAATGDWTRIKICPGDECGEAFLDVSRNRSRVWCDMSVCGNVAKAREYRARRRGVPSAKP